MANVEHSTLTGADLHEPKGVAAAAANRIYLANGSGSGSWTTVPAAAITAAGVLVFQSQKYHIRDERSSGTTGDTLTDATWNTRTIQTEKTDDLTITLSGNQFALAAGTYWVQGSVKTSITGGRARDIGQSFVSQIRLRNITDTTTALVGESFYWNNSFGGDNATVFGDTVDVVHPIMGQFTIAGTKTFELQNYVDQTNWTSPIIKGGRNASSGENEVYLDLVIWKLS